METTTKRPPQKREYPQKSIRSSPRPAPVKSQAPAAQQREDPILFQHYFKSVGPRTYAAQIKEARNGNQYLVLTEGKRDKETGDVRKTRVFVFSEDFAEFFHLMHETAVFIRQNPVPETIRRKREAYWRKQDQQSNSPVASKPEDSPRSHEATKRR